MKITESASLETKNEQELDLLSSQLKAKLESLELPLTSRSCIYKVPPMLRKVNEAAYTPTLVSIGPFHHGDTRLELMEKVKLRFLNKFLKRTQQKSLKDYVKALRDWEDKIRCCYSETIPMKSDDFVSMILIDACFIIEFFLTCLRSPKEDPWCLRPWPIHVNLDLILLENQLPFFVLERLFDLTLPNGIDGRSSFVKVTFDFFMAQFLQDIVPNEEICEKFTISYFEQYYLLKLLIGSVQVRHLNDMLRIFYLPRDQLPRRDYGMVKQLYSASQLHKKGIKFQVNQDKSIIELQYSNGVLKIPCLVVSDQTVTMIRNVIAFEQCHLPQNSYMIDYIFLFNYLINTGKDVEMLVKKDIMHNLLGDSDVVASMVNNLCKHVVQTTINNDYISLSNELNKFCDNPYHKFKVVFIRVYLSTPWRRIASFIPIILFLLLLLIQTRCSLGSKVLI